MPARKRKSKNGESNLHDAVASKDYKQFLSPFLTGPFLKRAGSLQFMSTDKKCVKYGQFVWNELVVADETSAKAFYGDLFGWKTESFGKGMEYSLLKKGDDEIGGMMKCPQPGMPSRWIPYVTVEDVDATLAKGVTLGGQIVTPAFDVPEVGRIAVLLDPQGACLGIIKPSLSS